MQSTENVILLPNEAQTMRLLPAVTAFDPITAQSVVYAGHRFMTTDIYGTSH